MKYLITEQHLVSETSDIEFEEFYILTGKRINFFIRKNKEIIVSRSNGHVVIFDTKFIINQIYKSNIDKFPCRCDAILNNGVAILQPLGHRMKIIESSQPELWEIKT